MNKIFNNVAKLALAVSAFAGATSAANAAKTATLYFKDIEGWGQVSCYVWKGNEKALGKFPGTKITTTLTDGTYVVNVPEDADGVIFNEGLEDHSRQTKNLKIVNNAVYDRDTIRANDASVKAIFFQNKDAKWNDLYIYSWDEADQSHSFGYWPGTKVTTMVDGDKYQITYLSTDKDYKFKFKHDGGAESMNYDLVAGHTYDQDGDMNDRKPHPVSEDITFFFNNHDTNWGRVYVYTWDSNDNHAFGSFPGKQITTCTRDGMYFINLPKDASAEKVIFSNGEGVQTSKDGFKIENHTAYNMNGGYYWDEEVPETRYVYFDNYDSNWNDVYVYAWDEYKHEPFGAWPGCKITNMEGETKFRLDYASDILAKRIKFNNGYGAETTDFDLVYKATYSINGMKKNVNDIMFDAMEAEATPASAIQSEIVEDGLTNVYSTSGVLVRENVQISNATDGLPQGIYIAKDLKGEYKSVYVK